MIQVFSINELRTDENKC